MNIFVSDLSPRGMASNCYAVIKGKNAVLIDATAPPDRLSAVLQYKNATLSAILLSHKRIEHIRFSSANIGQSIVKNFCNIRILL